MLTNSIVEDGAYATPTECYGRRFDDALAFCSNAFRFKRRKASGVPYLAHLLWVAATVAEHGGDEDQLIAALLHDVLEDIDGVTRDDLQERFGARVARLVSALSDCEVRPKPPWRERKERYLARLRDAPAEVKLVSAADKLHNVHSCVRDYRAVQERLWERFRGGRDGTLWYFREVLAALEQGWNHPLLDSLRAEVRELLALAGPVAPAL